MPCTTELRDDKGLILSCSGVLTGDELIKMKKGLITEQNRGRRYHIADLTAVAKFHITTSEIQAIVEVDKRLAEIAQRGMPVAVVAEDDLGFGLARMWEAFASNATGWRTMVFRSRKDAEFGPSSI